MRYLPILAGILFLCSGPLAHIVGAQPQVGEKAPLLNLPLLDGPPAVSKEALENGGKKVLLLSFFALWCPPCKEDLQYLQKIQKQYGAQGLQVLTVLTPNSFRKEDVHKLRRDLGVDLPIFFDELGAAAKKYGVSILPSRFIVDREGVLRARHEGATESAKLQLEEQLQALLSVPQRKNP